MNRIRLTLLTLFRILSSWQCGCGQLNHDTSGSCSMCGAGKP